MEDLTRRDAAKLAAAGLTAVGVTALGADSAPAQDFDGDICPPLIRFDHIVILWPPRPPRPENYPIDRRIVDLASHLAVFQQISPRNQFGDLRRSVIDQIQKDVQDYSRSTPLKAAHPISPSETIAAGMMMVHMATGLDDQMRNQVHKMGVALLQMGAKKLPGEKGG